MGYRSDIDQLANATVPGLDTRITALETEVYMGTSLALRYDQDADPPTYAYLGQAQPGTSTAAASWRIQKLVFNAGGDVTCTWADGNANFDNVWDNRASLTYT